jgi:hypothetical protein
VNGPAGLEGDGDPLIRSFLYQGSAAPRSVPEPSADLRDEIRPYLMTGGRTASEAPVDVAMETVVVVSRSGRPTARDRIVFERAAVLAECHGPRSVAEVAARLHLPLRVALVLVGDLIGEGLLVASTTQSHQADDIAFLERLIHGVRAL